LLSEPRGPPGDTFCCCVDLRTVPYFNQRLVLHSLRVGNPPPRPRLFHLPFVLCPSSQLFIRVFFVSINCLFYGALSMSVFDLITKLYHITPPLSCGTIYSPNTAPLHGRPAKFLDSTTVAFSAVSSEFFCPTFLSLGS